MKEGGESRGERGTKERGEAGSGEAEEREERGPDRRTQRHRSIKVLDAEGAMTPSGTPRRSVARGSGGHARTGPRRTPRRAVVACVPSGFEGTRCSVASPAVPRSGSLGKGKGKVVSDALCHCPFVFRLFIYFFCIFFLCSFFLLSSLELAPSETAIESSADL